ncbi:E3 ubiquitin-protein ligase SIN-like [Parasponia andersonii]|uniref:E3 ubiquitin-protein ligase SIN-like n=1 Tax=Parasponia andersonii TaxID=3476 RepID=A0A2P5A8I2_PARAD|nr:E3 ubiquitin-protein ligase SIN-like [Parasponia andersonii]
MASPPPPPLSSYDKSSQKLNKSKDASEQVVSADHSSNDCKNLNYDIHGFGTAPFSPTASSTQTSPPPLEQSKIVALSEPILRRDALPSHHLLKIDSFSSLSKASVEKYRSEFKAGGYKWNFLLYPDGDKTKEGQDHISLYLEMVDTTSFSAGWEVYAIFNLFIFDQIRDKYVGFQDATVRRFHCMKTQCGIAKFMALETFKNPSNGYLVNDTCSFGVEVFIVKNASKVERLSMKKDPVACKVAWTFDNFSRKSFSDERYESMFFFGGGYKWRIVFYPTGYQSKGEIKNYTNISAGLELDSSTLSIGTKIFVRYILRVRDQTKGNHFERSGNYWFGHSDAGFIEFMPMAEFTDLENGFLVMDACIIEVEFEVLGLVTLE